MLRAGDDEMERYASYFWSAFENGGQGVRFPALKMLRAAAARRQNPAARRVIEEMANRIESAPYPEIPDPPPQPVPPRGDPQSPGAMKPGHRYRVLRDFTDFDSQPVPAGRLLTFASYSYFPYDGGYTLCFEEGVIRLAEIDLANRDVLFNFPLYFTEAAG